MAEAVSIGTRFAHIAKVSDGKAESRKKMIGALRAAANRLSLSEGERRDICEAETGKRSASEMTLHELGKVLDRLNKNWKGPAGHRAHVGKVRALWWNLYFLGEVDANDDTVEKALDAFVQRQAKVASIRFLDHRAAQPVIEALKSWCARAGVRWPTAEQAASYGVALDIAERAAVTVAIWDKLAERRQVQAASPIAYVQRSLGLDVNHWSWAPREWDAGIRLLGKKLRHALGKEERSR